MRIKVDGWGLVYVLLCLLWLQGIAPVGTDTHHDATTRGQLQEAVRAKNCCSGGCGDNTGASEKGVGAMDAVFHILGPHAVELRRDFNYNN